MNRFTSAIQRPLATSPTDDETTPYWRWWMFGDSSSETHHFMEKAMIRAPKEIGCALAASLLVSPMVSIIDKCIVQDVSGTKQFMTAIAGASKEMVFTPRAFFGGLSFRLTTIVYFGTYAVVRTYVCVGCL